MLVGSNNGHIPAKTTHEICHLVEKDTFHAARITDGVYAVDDFHRDINFSSLIFSALSFSSVPKAINNAKTRKISVETLNHPT